MSENDIEKERYSKKNKGTPVTRRRLLNAVGAGAVGISGATLSGRVAGEESGKVDVPTTTSLNDKKQRNLVDQARNTEEFRRLSEEMREEYGATVTETSAVRLDIANERTINSYNLIDFTLAISKVQSSTSSDDGVNDKDRSISNVVANLVIVMDMSGEAVLSRASLIEGFVNSDEVRGTLITYDRNGVSTDTATINNSQTSTQSPSVTGSGVSTQQCGCSISKCAACQEIVGFVCKNGCGLSGLAICTALNIGGVAGDIGCGLLALRICQNIDLSSDCDKSAKNVCRYYGYC